MKKLTISILVSILLFSCGSKTKTPLVNETKDTTSTKVANENVLIFPKASGWINDFDSILIDREEKELDSICQNYENATTNQLVIATIQNLGSYSNIEEYSTDLFNEWKIGTKEKNNGVLIVLCKSCHEVRIATGTGAEKILTNEVCDKIVDPIMLSYFEKDKYFEGLKAGVKEIIKKWK